VGYNFFWSIERRICNRNARKAVLVNSVDTISTTAWMIMTHARWLKLRYGMMMRRLAKWYGGFIRLSQKWCAPSDRGELLRRIFAK
jgi:hypothetical protein